MPLFSYIVCKQCLANVMFFFLLFHYFYDKLTYICLLITFVSFRLMFVFDFLFFDSVISHPPEACLVYFFFRYLAT